MFTALLFGHSHSDVKGEHGALNEFTPQPDDSSTLHS